MKTLSELMGTLKVAVSIIWIGVFVLGLVYGLRGLDQIEAQFENSLNAASSGIDDINIFLREVTDVVRMIDLSLGTIEESAIDASEAMIETRPLLDESGQVVTEEIPQAIDDVQASMPNLIEAAALIDNTLRVLSKFNYELKNPLTGNVWSQISLGIDYDPEVPLDVALQNLSSNLEDIPDGMRGIQDDMDKATINVIVLSEDMVDVADDLALIRQQAADINPQLEVLVADLVKMKVSIQSMQSKAPDIFSRAKTLIAGIMILAIISQIPSVYIGYFVARESLEKWDSPEA